MVLKNYKNNRMFSAKAPRNYTENRKQILKKWLYFTYKF